MSSSFIQGLKIRFLRSKLDLRGVATLDGDSITANTVVVVDASNNILSSSTPTANLSYLNNTTSDIQTQLNSKLALSGGTITGALTITGTILAQTSIALEDPGAGTNKIVLQAPTLSSDSTYTLPTTYPASASLVLSSTTAGTMSWIAQSSSSGSSTNNSLTSTLANNQTSYADITGLVLDGATYRSSYVNYNIYRTTASATAFEVGHLDLVYDGATWYIDRQFSNDGGLDLTITTTSSSGQVQYKSTNMSGASYSGKMIFLASTLPQSGTNITISSSASLANNQSAFTDAAGLIVNGSLYRSANIKYNVYRTTSSATAFEVGSLDLVYDGATWYIDRQFSNDGGILDLDVTTTSTIGQIRYKSSNMAGTGYSGTISYVSQLLPV